MKSRYIPLLLATLLGPVTSQAGSIELSSVAGDLFYEANGQEMGSTTSIIWELGAFRSGFTPDSGNVGQWADNWRLLDGVAYSQTKQYITERVILVANPDTIAGGFVWERDDNDPSSPTTNPEIFFPGDQVYLWAYNDKAVSPDTEWALITSYEAGNSWTLNSLSGSALAFPVQWTLAAADTVVFGGLNDTSVSPNMMDPGGSYTVQTALVVAPVPEPGPAAVLLPGILGMLLGRRRRQAFFSAASLRS